MASPILGSVLQRAAFAAVVHKADLEILEWNAGAESLFGFTAAEAIGKKLPELLGAKVGVTRKDGKRIACHWQEEPLDDGSVLAIVTDVSEWKTRERLLKVLMDNLSVVVWQVDANGVFNFHDGKKALEGTGLTPGAVVGLDAFQVFADGDADVVLREALKGTPTIGRMTQFLGRNWQSWTLPLYDEEGRIDGAAGITLDISESQARESELRAKLALIEKHKKTIHALSIPLIEAWKGVLTVPIVGAVDTERASEVMEKLLTEITRRKARFAIVDLTGVDEIDTGVASHIIGLARAIQLLGAEGIVTGIRPSMAQTMVQLGADMSGIRTLSNLREALAYCIARLGAQE